MSSYEVFKKTNLYRDDPAVRHRVDLRIARDNTFEGYKLFNLDVEITSVCNLRCRTCYNPFIKNITMSVEQFGEVIKKGNNLAKQLNLDGLWITISGGEPFTHPQLLEILELSRTEGVLGIAIITNGTLLTKNVVSAIDKLNINEIMISIDGGTEHIHDHIRGYGSFKQMLLGVDCLHQNSPTTFTGTTLTLTSENFTEIESYVKLSFDLGFCYAWINPPLLTGRLPNNSLSISLEQSLKASELVRTIDNSTLKYGFNVYYNLPYYALNDPISPFADFQTACPFGRNNLTVCSNGDVLPCLYSRDYVLGNIFENDLLSIFNTPDLVLYRSGELLAKECKACNLAMFCGGCRARTFYRTGEWFERDTWCPLIAESRKKT